MSIRLPDSFELGYWTEFEGTSLDDIIHGDSIRPVTSSYTAIGLAVDPILSSQKIRVSSRSSGFITISGSLRTVFEENAKQHVFRTHEYDAIQNGINRGQLQNRYRQVTEDTAFGTDQKAIGKPIILDTLVPQAPDVILALSRKLTSQWYLPKIQSESNLYKFSSYFSSFELNHFYLNPPFAYNHTDLFANKIAGKAAFVNDSYVAYFSDNPPDGNYHGKGFVPYIENASEITTSVVQDTTSVRKQNFFNDSSVFVGLGHFKPDETNTRMNNGAYPLPVNIDVPNLDVFSSSLSSYPISGTLSYLFEKREQPNLCEEWLNVYPNEHRFKNLNRLYRNRRKGSDVWGSASNAAYSVQGWSITPDYQYDDNGLINNRTLASLFWKFDKGFRVNHKPLFSSDFTFTAKFPYLSYELRNPYTWVEGEYSPTILMVDFLGTTKTNVQTFSVTNSYVMFPKLAEMLSDTNTKLQLSMSYTPVFPSLENINKAFYGFGDGIVERPSEYTYPDLGNDVSSVLQNGKYYWHRKKYVWGKGKVPSFERSYKFLHSMTVSLFPTPQYETAVTFSYVSSSIVTDYGKEPDIWSETSIAYPGYPNSTTPNWFEGPVVVSGPVLRGYKYGLLDANPRTAKCIYRKGHFGQFRDMLEPRLFYAYKTSDESEPVYVVRAKFVSGTSSDTTASNYRNWKPGDSEPYNKSDSGIYDDYCRVGKPYNDSGW